MSAPRRGGLRVAIAALAFAISLCVGAPSADAARRALIIGNADYGKHGSASTLVWPAKSAERYREIFKQFEFDTVMVRTDLELQPMQTVIAEFIDKINKDDDVIFIFTGHGFSDDKANYLAPLDIDVGRTPLAKRSTAVSLDILVNNIKSKLPKRLVVVIDACQTPEDPERRSDRIQISVAENMFVFLSSAPQSVAYDRLSTADTEPLTVFARHFAPELEKGGNFLDIARATEKRVREAARRAGKNQDPVIVPNLEVDFFLGDPPQEDDGVACTPGDPASLASARARWREVFSAKACLGEHVLWAMGAPSLIRDAGSEVPLVIADLSANQNNPGFQPNDRIDRVFAIVQFEGGAKQRFKLERPDDQAALRDFMLQHTYGGDADASVRFAFSVRRAPQGSASVVWRPEQ